MVENDGARLSFDAVNETLRRSSLGLLYTGRSISQLGTGRNAAYGVDGVFNGNDVLLPDRPVYIDANGNGVLDFLDQNGDGVQDDDEPHEPSATTAADVVVTVFGSSQVVGGAIVHVKDAGVGSMLSPSSTARTWNAC